MADSYLSIAAIAKDEFMLERMYSAVSQQLHLGNITIPLSNVTDPFSAQEWVNQYRYIWASSPSWGEKWTYALDSGNAEPGKDSAVITDGDILATVQALLKPAPPQE
jgi:hypothetical protein